MPLEVCPSLNIIFNLPWENRCSYFCHHCTVQGKCLAAFCISNLNSVSYCLGNFSNLPSHLLMKIFDSELGIYCSSVVLLIIFVLNEYKVMVSSTPFDIHTLHWNCLSLQQCFRNVTPEHMQNYKWEFLKKCKEWDFLLNLECAKEINSTFRAHMSEYLS